MKHRLKQFTPLGLVIAMLVAVSCGPTPAPGPAPAESPTVTRAPATPTVESLMLTSPAFDARGMIPQRYTRRGDDTSPPLEWGDPPAGTESFALLVTSDPMPDGGGNWVQWILYNIPSASRALPEGVTPDVDGRLPDGSQHYENSWGELKYGGPSPPHASTQNYYFVLYALDAKFDLKAVEEAARDEGTLPWIGATKEVFLRAVEGHILARGELVGKYREE